MFKNFFKLSFILFLSIFFISGCSLPLKKVPAVVSPEVTVDEPVESTVDIVFTNRLKKFSSYEDLAEFLAVNTNPDVSYPSALLASGYFQSGSDNLSLPNNSLGYFQEKEQSSEIDESDIIKTNGAHVYALVKNELFIIKAIPASEAQVLSKITFKSRPRDIFVKDGFLAVFGNNDQIYNEDFYKDFRRKNPYVFFEVFDVSNPASPKQVRDLDFEGTYNDARLIGDYVYFLTDTYSNYIANESLTPYVLDNGQALSTKCDVSSKCFSPDIYYFDIPYSAYSFMNIAAINIKNNSESISGQSYLLNEGQDFYFLQDSIYITHAQYLDERGLEDEARYESIFPRLSSEDQDKIKKIEDSSSFVLNENEKKYKVAQIFDRYYNSLTAAESVSLNTNISSALATKLAEKFKEKEKTIIHKIVINNGKIEYRAMGEVSGRIISKTSIGEEGNYLRVATAKKQSQLSVATANQDSYSSVFVLDSNLKTIGSLENLATTEKIYSAHFIGDRVYLITFKQSDPLFVIDLSNPTKPAVLGALKVPGMSNYLHPTDKNGNILIGLGREVEEVPGGLATGKGLKLSLFDFSDLKKPMELDNFLLGDENSSSITLSDHKSFLYSVEKKILSVPAAIYEKGKLAFAGSLVFSFDNGQLGLKGKVDHSSGGNFTQVDMWNGINYYNNTVKRSFYIEDNIYTFSNKYLKINSLADMAEIKSIELTAGGYDYIITPAADDTAQNTVQPGDSPAAETSNEMIMPEEGSEMEVDSEAVVIDEESPVEELPINEEPLEENMSVDGI